MTLTGTTFDAATAKLCVNLCTNCYNGPWQIESSEAHVTITTAGDGTQYVCFRGSKSAQDWIEDGEVRMVPFEPGGSIHRGFKSSFISVSNQMAKSLRMDKPVVVCGHSLGGAQAVIAASLLAYNRFNVLACYTFGQPRVGNGKFKAFCDKWVPNHYRFVNGQDIVPRVPAWLLGYRHSGAAFLIEGGKIDPWPKFTAMALLDMTGIASEWLKHKKIALLNDHHIQFYQKPILELPTAPPEQAGVPKG